MLTRSSIQSAITLAKLINSQNRFRLIPEQSSFVDESYRLLSNFNKEFVYDEEDLIDGLMTTANSVKVNDESAKSEHDALMDWYIPKLSSVVAQHIKFTRSVVLEEAKQLTSSILANFNKEMKTPEDFINIEYITVSPIYQHPMIDELVSGYKESFNAYVLENLSPDTESIPETDFIDLLKTGDESFDLELINLIKTVGLPTIRNSINAPKIAMLDNYETLLHDFVNFLFYKNVLETERFDSIRHGTNMSLTKLRAVYADNRDFFGSKLKYDLSSFRNFLRKGLFVLPLESNRVVIDYMYGISINVRVIEENYDRFVNNGGSMEALLGFIITEKSAVPTRQENLINNPSYYENEWFNARKIYFISAQKYSLEAFKTVVRYELLSSINNEKFDKEYREHIANFDQYTETIAKQDIEQFVSMLTADDIEKVDQLAIDFIAKCKYKKSSAKNIIEYMSSILKHHSLETDEAAFVATMMYVVDFMFSQIKKVSY